MTRLFIRLTIVFLRLVNACLGRSAPHANCLDYKDLPDSKAEVAENLIIKEYTGHITPAEQEQLDLLLSADPGFKRLKVEMYRGFSDPRLAAHIESLSNFRVADVKRLLRARRRRAFRKWFEVTVARVDLFTVVIILQMPVIFLLSYLLSDNVALSLLLSMVTGIGTRMVAKLISAIKEKDSREAEKICKNIEAWMAFQGLPPLSEETIPEIKERLQLMAQDPRSSEEEKQLAAFLLRPTGKEAMQDD